MKIEREIESEKKMMRNGGWWRHREETMNTKGRKRTKSNQFLYQKQHMFSSLQFRFYRDTGGGSYAEATHRVILFRVWLKC